MTDPTPFWSVTRSVTDEGVDTNDNPDITFPTGLQTGMKAAVLLMTSASADTHPTPPGWTVSSATVSTGTVMRTTLYTRDVDGSDDGANHVFTIPSGARRWEIAAVIVQDGIMGGITTLSSTTSNFSMPTDGPTPASDDNLLVVLSNWRINSAVSSSLGNAGGLTSISQSGSTHGTSPRYSTAIHTKQLVGQNGIDQTDTTLTITAANPASTKRSYSILFAPAITTTPVTPKTIGTTWNVRAAIAKTTASSWNVRAAISRTIATSWKVRTVVAAKTVASTWNVRQAITKTTASTWKVRAAIARTVASTWNVRTAIARTVASNWKVRSAVAPKTTATTWKVRQVLARSVGSTWNVRGALVRTIASTWNTRARVTPQTIATSWDVEADSGLTQVTRTVGTTWKVRAQVAKTTGTTWNTRAQVGRTVASSWKVRQAVSKTTSSTWKVRSTVAPKITATTWKVRAQTSRTVSTSWRVRSRATSTTSTTWNTRSRLVAQTPTQWAVRALVERSISTSWDVLEPVASPHVDVRTAAVATRYRSSESVRPLSAAVAYSSSAVEAIQTQPSAAGAVAYTAAEATE